jgi:hypothetical protein
MCSVLTINFVRFPFRPSPVFMLCSCRRLYTLFMFLAFLVKILQTYMDVRPLLSIQLRLDIG